MSHAPQRKEKNCLNCGTTVIGRSCHVCGQENLEPKESVWQIVTHFFNDITHFDGKFFQSLNIFLTRPGFLSREYVNGKRASYLNPVRMYVFTSAIFFLIFFSFLQRDEPVNVKINGKTLDQIKQMDSATFAAFAADMNTGGKPLTKEQFYSTGLQLGDVNFKSRKEYDSALASGRRKDNWITRQFIYKLTDINERYKTKDQFLSAFTHQLTHSTPQMLFISLPLLALILKLLYVRRKQFYYVSHGIFAIHLYIFVFIDLLVIFGLSKINRGVDSQVLRDVSGVLISGIFVYQYLAMKNFYRQGWAKTFLKFCLLNIIFSVVLSLLFVIFIFFSFFNI